MVHAHIGHVADSFKDTPNQQGLLPASMAEAKVAATHAALAAKNTTDLAAMKLHAGPVASQLIPGVDANKDGRVSWEAGEGGLEQAQAHMQLMKKGEGLP